MCQRLKYVGWKIHKLYLYNNYPHIFVMKSLEWSLDIFSLQKVHCNWWRSKVVNSVFTIYLSTQTVSGPGPEMATWIQTFTNSIAHVTKFSIVRLSTRLRVNYMVLHLPWRMTVSYDFTMNSEPKRRFIFGYLTEYGWWGPKYGPHANTSHLLYTDESERKIICWL